MTFKIAAIVGSILLALLAVQTWRVNRAVKQNVALEIQRDQAQAQVAAEQAARAHEQRIAKDASNGYQSKVAELQSELAASPLGPVVIRVRNPASVPGANGSASAATGPDAEAEGRLDRTVEIDIAPGLTAYAFDCQANTAQLTALQGWVEAR